MKEAREIVSKWRDGGGARDDEGEGEDNDIAAVDDNENSAGFFFNGEEVRLGASQAATLAHLESIFIDPAEQLSIEKAHLEDCNDV